jgi:hypothetical protein
MFKFQINSFASNFNILNDMLAPTSQSGREVARIDFLCALSRACYS